LFRYYKKLAEGAIQQVSDEQLYAVLDPEMNSITVIVKHLTGNMHSRWTDFLTSDGEKPDRNRDSEFETPPEGREALLKLWEAGWNCVFAALDPLAESDLTRTVAIRGEPHSVPQTINRQLAHNAYHVGQIVLLAKHFQQPNWRSLSVPRGRSEEFNRRVSEGKASGESANLEPGHGHRPELLVFGQTGRDPYLTEEEVFGKAQSAFLQDVALRFLPVADVAPSHPSAEVEAAHPNGVLTHIKHKLPTP